jgi:pimeloyl-ACP methyl ester carboxylesterase
MKLEVLRKLAKKKTNQPPLLFIHGAAGGAWYFKHFLSYFSNHGYDCYALSLRGHGKSEGYEDIDTYRLDDYVSDVKSVVSILKKKPILIGHSMGGAITQRFISDYQDEIHAAILLSSAEAGGIDKDSHLGLFFNDTRDFLRKLKKENPNEKITLDHLLNQTIFSNRMNPTELSEIRKRLTKESSLVKKDLLEPFIDDYTRITIPIGVIGSKDDMIIDESKIMKTASAFNVEPIILNDLCHFLTIDPNWENAAHAILVTIRSFK